MAEPQDSRRPWWKRKRSASALAAWLLVASVIAYPASLGPWYYCAQRGWLAGPAGDQFYWTVYGPLANRWQDWPTWYDQYTNWFRDLGERHAAQD